MLPVQPNYKMNNINAIKRSELFTGIPLKDIKDMINCLNAYQRDYKKGEIILWEGDIINEIGIILSGHGRSIKNDITGNTVIVTLLEEGSLIGVLLSASYSRVSPVSVQATDKLSVIFIPIKNVIGRCHKLCQKHDIFLHNVLNCIAEKALVLHDRNDCLIKPSIRSKVLTYLTRLSKEQRSKTLTLPFNRESMSEYLNVDRSALSRELSNMKKEGLIDFYKNKFILFYHIK